MIASAPQAKIRWSGTWLDVVGFAFGLALAWIFDWETADLIWSLWLSSLVVGYGMIVWILTQPLREVAAGAWRDRAPLAPVAVTGGLLGAGTLFMLAFFTVHFGGFHFVHSAFLASFFPLTPENGGPRVSGGFPSLGMYAEVVRRYWIFLPAAFLAERHAFARPKAPQTSPADPVRQLGIPRVKPGHDMMRPYANVIRMHLLIFFFAAAHIARLENFILYAVAYAAYFFPWQAFTAWRAERKNRKVEKLES